MESELDQVPAGTKVFWNIDAIYPDGSNTWVPWLEDEMTFQEATKRIDAFRADPQGREYRLARITVTRDVINA